jgi:hypothetical protein
MILSKLLLLLLLLLSCPQGQLLNGFILKTFHWEIFGLAK